MTRRKSKPAPPPSGLQLQAQALERYRPLLGEEDFAALLAELQRPLPQAIRLNPLKVDTHSILAEWAGRYGWQVRPLAYCPTGYQILAAAAPLSQTIEHRLGEYYIQDAASMLPVELFDLDHQNEPLILDMAASPGGKTTHLISRSMDRGLVIANDASPSRLPALRQVLAQWGAMNIATTSFPGEQFGAWFPERFDRVLLDAPCSMENLRSSESHPMRPISARERTGLAHRQARLLASALQAVRVGGEVVYATCTLSPQEDEAVLESALELYPHAVQIESTSGRLPGISAPALVTDGEHVFDPTVMQALRLWPHRYGTSGFFSALLSKTDTIAGGEGTAPQRPFAATGLTHLIGQTLARWLDGLGEQYGFDLAPLLAAQRLGIWQRGGLLFAIPEAFLEHFQGLPYQSLGLLIGEDTPQGFEPSHEFVARCGAGFTRRRLMLADELIPAWLSGMDIRPAPAADGAAKGSIVIVCDRQARLLGRGRMLSDRVKNLLPKRNF